MFSLKPALGRTFQGRRFEPTTRPTLGGGARPPWSLEPLQAARPGPLVNCVWRWSWFCSRSSVHRPQHFLNFLALPQGHGSLRPTLTGARYGSTLPSRSNSPAAASVARSSPLRPPVGRSKRAHHHVAAATSSIGGHLSFMRSRRFPRGDVSTSLSSEEPMCCGSMSPSSYARRSS